MSGLVDSYVLHAVARFYVRQVRAIRRDFTAPFVSEEALAKRSNLDIDVLRARIKIMLNDGRFYDYN